MAQCSARCLAARLSVSDSTPWLVMCSACAAACSKASGLARWRQSSSISNMPELRGDKLVGVLRSNARLNGVALILLSGQPQDELDRPQRDLPADAVIAKRDLSVLTTILSRVLSQRADQQG